MEKRKKQTEKKCGKNGETALGARVGGRQGVLVFLVTALQYCNVTAVHCFNTRWK